MKRELFLSFPLSDERVALFAELGLRLRELDDSEALFLFCLCRKWHNVQLAKIAENAKLRRHGGLYRIFSGFRRGTPLS